VKAKAKARDGSGAESSGLKYLYRKKPASRRGKLVSQEWEACFLL
jgi:hypothetical protein